VSGRPQDLERKLGYAFRDASLLDLALRHRSQAVESGAPDRHNDRLEFLGDAILGFIVGERLFHEAGGGGKVGDLSRRRADLVSAPALAERARDLGLGAHLRLGKGEESSGGREKESLLADAFESVLAAIFLDGGLEAARGFVLRSLGPRIAIAATASPNDPKSRLQEILQARGLSVPEYRVVAESGSAQAPRFEVEVLSRGAILGRGAGRTKKIAEASAAREALLALGPTSGGRS
jgi:ribonuclease-3